MRVQPAPGVLIRCPETKRLYGEADQVTVPKHSKTYAYWRRRVRDGDAVVITADEGSN
jgi:hypothetical protein